jgi:iron(III) transport system permease protein
MKNSPVIQRSRFYPNGEIIGHGLGLLLFLVLALGPLLGLTFELLQFRGSDLLDWIRLALPMDRKLDLLLRSVGLAAGVAVFGMLTGTLAASMLWRHRKGKLGYLRWLLLMLIPVPPYIHAQAWNTTAFMINSWLAGHGLPMIEFQGFLASWWVQTMALLPVAVGLALIALELVDGALIESARCFRPDMQVFLQIVLPLAAPIIWAAGGFLFLLTLNDYSVPSLFSLNVYPLEIFAEYSAHAQPVRALLLSLPLLVITLSVIIFSQSAFRNAALARSQRPFTGVNNFRFSRFFSLLQLGAVLLLVLQIGIPLVSLVLSLESWQGLFSAAGFLAREGSFSFLVAGAATLLCLPPALSIAWEMSHSGTRSHAAWLLATIPLSIPAPLIGIGLITVWNHPVFSNLYASAWMPILASLSRFIPLAAIILLAQMRRFDHSLIDAARILHTGFLRSWIQVRLPLLAPGLMAAAALTFAMSLGELGATLIVAPPGKATLTMRIYNYLHFGATNQVAGLCLIMILLTLASGFMAAIALSGWSRMFQGRQDKLEEK